MAQSVKAVRATLTATGTGTTDFTSTGFGTPSAAIIIVCNANATNNPQVGANFSIGFWDGTNQRAVGVGLTDGVTTMQSERASDDSYGIIAPNPAGVGLFAAYAVSAITDGIRMTMSVDNTGVQRFCSVILLAGVSASVGTITVNTTENGTEASASLGFAPELVFMTTIGSTSTDESDVIDAVLSFGFAKSDGTHRMVAFGSDAGAADEIANILFSESRCVGQCILDATTWTGEITTFGADTFTLTTRDGSSGSDVAFYLALGGDLSVDVGTLTTPTSTGNSAVATDVSPDAVLLMLSTATGTTLHTDSGANGFMVGMADDDGQFAHNMHVEDAAATSNTNSTAQAAAVIDLDTSSSGTRADMIDATVTLNASDFTLNYSAVDATARKGWWVAFGAAAGGGTGGPLIGGRLINGMLVGGRLAA